MTNYRFALVLGLAIAAISACAAPSEILGGGEEALGSCGGAGQACCATGARCTGELGCAGGVCVDIDTNMVAYTEYCKEQLGFVDPRKKMAFVSCFDAQGADGERHRTGRQAQLKLTRRAESGYQTLSLTENGPPVHAGRDIWDLMFGTSSLDGDYSQENPTEAGGEGCDNPNYLSGACDPYYRMNVFRPDPGNADVTAALHCRSSSWGARKPKPANAISADARLAAYQASSSADPAERQRLFDQYNDSSEIVLTMTNTRTGKACFFHAAGPYFGSHIPAPDDETDLARPENAEKVWRELPVTPPYPASDSSRRSQWLRNGANAWQRPDYMRCTGCHDSGSFMHDPFIDSMNDPDGTDYLPRDSARRPYLPLGWQGRGYAKTFIKTGPVKNGRGELEPQKCTMCHAMGSERQCDGWFDRAVGWSFPYSSSAASRELESLKRYMPFEHGAASSAEFYAEYGPHLDAMKCCCEHPGWRGCKSVPASTPTAPGSEGTDARSCTDSTCGAHGQECCAGTSCNHGGLTCDAGRCRYRDE